MRARILLAIGVAAIGVVVIAVFAGRSAPNRAPSLSEQLAACDALGPGDRRRSCFADRLTPLLDGVSPTDGIARIERSVSRQGGFVESNCHVLMHEVGRRYARAHDVTLASMMRVLPRSDNPGCAAGFSHGMITAVAPEIDLEDPRASARAGCGRAPTRFQLYSCIHGFGHAFMRIHDERLRPALELCSALGPTNGPDCAQGAFHDYWLAVVGLDRARAPDGADGSPDRVCGKQPAEFVRPCWYRAFLDTRPAGYRTETPEQLVKTCERLRGLQRKGCVTAASVIGPPNPLVQIRMCAAVPRVDVVPCLQGVKVQNIMGTPETNQFRVLSRCTQFAGEVRRECLRWFGKTLSVITNGRFVDRGCPRLSRARDREACEQGAGEMNDALVTFS